MKTAFTLLLASALAPMAWAQEGAAERAGKSIDNAAKTIRREVENAVDSVLSGVQQKELQTRTYFRLHWDRALNKASLNVDVKENGTVVLRGSVTDTAAKKRAVELAQTTVGVMAVIDELIVGKAKPVKLVPGSPEPPDREVPPVKNTEIKPSGTP